MSVRQSLLAILAQGACYGYQLRAELERRSGSDWSVNVGQIYTTLDRLHGEGLVAPVEDDGDGERRPWKLTPEGKEAVDAWFDDVSTTRPDNWAAPRIVVGDPAVGTVVLSRQDWRIDDAMADMGELAGWLGTTQGWWEVDVAAAGTLDVTVRLEPFTWARPDLFSTVTLKVGDRAWSVPAVLQCTRYELEVDVDAGPTEIEAWATGGPNGRTSALYVDIARKVTTTL